MGGKPGRWGFELLLQGGPDTMPRPGVCPAQRFHGPQAPARAGRRAWYLYSLASGYQELGLPPRDKVCPASASAWPHSPPTPAMYKRWMK